jgi:hypothetical protein
MRCDNVELAAAEKDHALLRGSITLPESKADDGVFDRVLTVDVGSSVATLSDTPQRLLFGDSTA